MISIPMRRPFATYKTNETILIESGTYLGGGVQDALDAGFEKVLSYEIVPGLYHKAAERFRKDPRVHIFKRLASTMFDDIRFIDQRMMFWLNAHYYSFLPLHDATRYILDELEEIAKHPITTHTILIDDIHMLQTSGIDIEDVKNLVSHINPMYQFDHADGYRPNDILVAHLLQ